MAAAVHAPSHTVYMRSSFSRPSSSVAPSGSNGGLRGCLALRSSFSRPSSLSLLMIPSSKQHQPRASAAPRVVARVASKQAYICRDCRTPFDKLADNYFCPVCGAPKRRFRPYEPKVSKNANATDARKARKAELKKDEAIGQALPIVIVVGVIALAGLYLYLNNTF